MLRTFLILWWSTVYSPLPASWTGTGAGLCELRATVLPVRWPFTALTFTTTTGTGSGTGLAFHEWGGREQDGSLRRA